MSPPSSADRHSLRVGYGRADITPALGAPLAGVIARRGRPCTRLRDPLFARAVQLASANAEAFLVSVDLLAITGELTEAVARRAGVDRRSLLLAATHTHSAPGGYWDAGRGELFMGPFERAAFDHLVEQIGAAIGAARRDAKPARALAASTQLVGVSANRRQRHGPVDPELLLVRFDVAGADPIDIVSFGAHPVVGCVREPGVCSADFPGELCTRLERRGHRPLFFTGAVGGLSPLFGEFPQRLDDHLELLGDLLERGVGQAERELHPVPPAELVARTLAVPLPDPSCTIFPTTGPLWRAAAAAAWPLRRWMLKMAADARAEDRALLPLVRLGEVAFLGTPCDLGVNVALRLKATLHRAGMGYALVGSQCNGYVGYVHLERDYGRTPEAGFRHMAYYENAMSLSGHHMGEQFVAAVAEHLATSEPDGNNSLGPP